MIAAFQVSIFLAARNLSDSYNTKAQRLCQKYLPDHLTLSFYQDMFSITDDEFPSFLATNLLWSPVCNLLTQWQLDEERKPLIEVVHRQG